MKTAALSVRCQSSEIGAGGAWSTISMDASASFRIAPSRLRHSAATDGVTEYMRAFAIICAGIVTRGGALHNDPYFHDPVRLAEVGCCDHRELLQWIVSISARTQGRSGRRPPRRSAGSISA